MIYSMKLKYWRIACAILALAGGVPLSSCAEEQYRPLVQSAMADLRMKAYAESATAYVVPGACDLHKRQVVDELVKLKDPRAPEPFVVTMIPASVPIGVGFVLHSAQAGQGSCTGFVQITPQARAYYVVTAAVSTVDPKDPVCVIRAYIPHISTGRPYWEEPVAVSPLSESCK